MEVELHLGIYGNLGRFLEIAGTEIEKQIPECGVC